MGLLEDGIALGSRDAFTGTVPHAAEAALPGRRWLYETLLPHLSLKSSFHVARQGDFLIPAGGPTPDIICH